MMNPIPRDKQQQQAMRGSANWAINLQAANQRALELKLTAIIIQSSCV